MMQRVLKESLTYDDGQVCLDGKPFTGIAYFVDENEQLLGEITYQDGLEWGRKWECFEPGKMSFECSMFLGVVHGKSREWHYNGQLAEEADYELGFTLRQKSWNEDGELKEDYELKETDPDYAELKKYRDYYQDDLAQENAAKP